MTKMNYLNKNMTNAVAISNFFRHAITDTNFASYYLNNREKMLTDFGVDPNVVSNDKSVRLMPNAMTLRHQTVEHPFGTIKQWAGTHQLLTKTLKHVKTEVSLQVLAYNFKRMTNIMGVNGLISALKN